MMATLKPAPDLHDCTNFFLRFLSAIDIGRLACVAQRFSTPSVVDDGARLAAANHPRVLEAAAMGWLFEKSVAPRAGETWLRFLHRLDTAWHAMARDGGTQDAIVSGFPTVTCNGIYQPCAGRDLCWENEHGLFLCFDVRAAPPRWVINSKRNPQAGEARAWISAPIGPSDDFVSSLIDTFGWTGPLPDGPGTWKCLVDTKKETEDDWHDHTVTLCCCQADGEGNRVTSFEGRMRLVRSRMLSRLLGISEQQQQQMRYTNAAAIGIQAAPGSFDISPAGDANYRAACAQRLEQRRREIFEADGSCGLCGGFNGGVGCEECHGTGLLQAS